MPTNSNLYYTQLYGVNWRVIFFHYFRSRSGYGSQIWYQFFFRHANTIILLEVSRFFFIHTDGFFLFPPDTTKIYYLNDQ